MFCYLTTEFNKTGGCMCVCARARVCVCVCVCVGWGWAFTEFALRNYGKTSRNSVTTASPLESAFHALTTAHVSSNFERTNDP